MLLLFKKKPRQSPGFFAFFNFCHYLYFHKKHPDSKRIRRRRQVRFLVVTGIMPRSCLRSNLEQYGKNQKPCQAGI
ncbi:MAG: hypothetical protein DRH90_00350 [Deltaproteobacteria bacterium]|nr:MAG: hypothetical protein DRH90_00350 [Deltaproteobacteria bacterium]RLC19351.1 MAG: hypothetical protein DRI24_00435 [Deltaproteobacteria bacterium]